MSVHHPYSVGRYKVMANDVKLVKDHGCSDSEVLLYALVKYYIFSGSGIRPYIHMFVRPYIGPFQNQLVYFLILTP